MISEESFSSTSQIHPLCKKENFESCGPSTQQFWGHILTEHEHGHTLNTDVCHSAVCSSERCKHHIQGSGYIPVTPVSVIVMHNAQMHICENEKWLMTVKWKKQITEK